MYVYGVAAHLRSFFEKVATYTFARILFPGKRYDCAHCIFLAAQLSVLGQATDLLNNEWLMLLRIMSFIL